MAVDVYFCYFLPLLNEKFISLLFYLVLGFTEMKVEVKHKI